MSAGLAQSLTPLFSNGNKILHPHKFLPVMSYIVQFIDVTFYY